MMEIEIIRHYRYLNYAVHYRRPDEFLCNFIRFNFRHTRHSSKRAAQRGFTADKIIAALEYGESYYKQGLEYYVLGENDIPEGLYKQREKLKNTVVVVDGNTGTVLTCYRSANPHKHIKRKQKQLAPRKKMAA